MNSPLLTTEGVILFIATPSVLLLIAIWYIAKYMPSWWRNPFSTFPWRAHIGTLLFCIALALFELGAKFGGENTAYRYPAQKINDQNFSLFYSNDLKYRVISDSKQWENIQGDILVTKRRSAWGKEISERVIVVPTVKQNK